MRLGLVYLYSEEECGIELGDAVVMRCVLCVKIMFDTFSVNNTKTPFNIAAFSYARLLLPLPNVGNHDKLDN